MGTVQEFCHMPDDFHPCDFKVMSKAEHGSPLLSVKTARTAYYFHKKTDRSFYTWHINQPFSFKLYYL